MEYIRAAILVLSLALWFEAIKGRPRRLEALLACISTGVFVYLMGWLS